MNDERLKLLLIVLLFLYNAGVFFLGALAGYLFAVAREIRFHQGKHWGGVSHDRALLFRHVHPRICALRGWRRARPIRNDPALSIDQGLGQVGAFPRGPGPAPGAALRSPAQAAFEISP